MEKMKANYEVMLALAAEMILDEAMLKFRQEKIYAAIDDALESRDKESFEKLSAQLKTFRR